MRAAALPVLAVAFLAGCGGGDDEEPARPPVTETSVAPPQRPPEQPAVPRAERAAAVTLVSRYITALERTDVERACSLVHPLALRNLPGSGGCEQNLRAFAQGSRRLRDLRTVPVWDRGAVDAGTGVLNGRVKVGFPDDPAFRWVFKAVKEPETPWRLGTARPSEVRAAP